MTPEDQKYPQQISSEKEDSGRDETSPEKRALRSKGKLTKNGNASGKGHQDSGGGSGRGIETIRKKDLRKRLP